MSAPVHHPAADPELHARLHRWVAEQLISSEEADAIEAFESRRLAEAPAPKRVPLITEALAYVGGALAAAAAVVLLGDAWEDLAPGARGAIVGVAAFAAIAAGSGLRRSEEPAYARLASLLWFVGVGLATWLARIVAADILELGERTTVLAASASASVFAAAFYALRRRALQQLALLSALAGLAAAIVGDAPGAPTAAWGVGAAWLLLGSLGRIRPPRIAMAAGAVLALWAPQGIRAAAGGGYGMWLGLGTAVAVLALGVTRREVVLLGLGGVGLFGYLVWVLADRFGQTAGMPLALLGAGLLVLAVAIGSARRSGRTLRPGSPRTPS